MLAKSLFLLQILLLFNLTSYHIKSQKTTLFTYEVPSKVPSQLKCHNVVPSLTVCEKVGEMFIFFLTFGVFYFSLYKNT